MDKFSYDGLTISSGGYKGLAILGALTPLSMYGCFKNTKYFSGCSVGSIITLLIACGWNPIDLYHRVVKIRLFNGISDIDINRLKQDYGLISNELFRQELTSLILEKRQTIPTFLDLHNEGIYIAFSIADRRTKKEYKLDYMTNPTLSTCDAALMSSNIPFIFPPIDFNGMKVVDGALANPFPANYIDDGQRKILGIVVYGKESEEDTFVSHFSEIMMIQIESLQNYLVENVSCNVDILKMIVDDIGIISITSSYIIKNNMYFKGVSDGLLLYEILEKKIRREERHKRKAKKENEHVEKNESEKLNESRVDKENTKPKSLRTQRSSFNARIPIMQIPIEVLVKCLLSQPLDILMHCAEFLKDKLEEALKQLSSSNIEKLKLFSKFILKDDPVSGKHTEEEPKPKQNYIINEKVKIRENYSQKIYDKLPLPFQMATRSIVESLGKEDSGKIISGVNTIIEGLTMLGIDVFAGLSLDGPRLYTKEEPEHQERSESKVEILEEEIKLPKKRDIENID